MGIKTQKRFILFLFLLSFIILTNSSYGINLDYSVNRPLLNAQELPDKVYTFQSPDDALILEELYLKEFYTYYIWVEMVTPHNCSLYIKIWDPDDKLFTIFENDLYIEPEGGRYYEIPFGTAISGNYRLEFIVITTHNVNIYIRIREGPKCLMDKIPLESQDSEVYYNVHRFFNKINVSHDIHFKSDYAYKFYIGRVSPISIQQDNIVYVDFLIRDPEGMVFTIYSNKTLASIKDVNKFKFGTASEGIYTFYIRISSSVQYTNIGYSIFEDHKIGRGTYPNQTQSTNRTSLWTNIYEFANEWTIGIIMFFGGLGGIILIVIVKGNKKNIAGVKERSIPFIKK
jgi:hypothetical protein